MPKPEIVLGYGMREVSHGKWEAFRIHLAGDFTSDASRHALKKAGLEVSYVSLTPVHRIGLMKTEWGMGDVPDYKQPDNPRAVVVKKILIDVPDIDPKTKQQRTQERRGERMELAERRMREAQRLEQQLGLRDPKKKAS